MDGCALEPSFTSDPGSFWDVLKFGFLGAYSFILQMLIRRFFQSDLRPAAYANALLRLGHRPASS